jgi:hypothetical protein
VGVSVSATGLLIAVCGWGESDHNDAQLRTNFPDLACAYKKNCSIAGSIVAEFAEHAVYSRECFSRREIVLI